MEARRMERRRGEERREELVKSGTASGIHTWAATRMNLLLRLLCASRFSIDYTVTVNNEHSVCGGVSRVVAQWITHPTLTLSDTKLSEQYFRRSLFPSPFAPTHPSYAATIVSRSESPLARFNLASCAASRRLNGATNGSRWETAAATVRTGSRQLKMA